MGEAGVDEEGLEGRADDGVAVEALEGEALDAAAADVVGEGLEGLVEPGAGRAVGLERVLEGDQALAGALGVEDGLGVEGDDVGASDAGSAAVVVALRPGERGAERVGGIGGGEDEWTGGLVGA